MKNTVITSMGGSTALFCKWGNKFIVQRGSVWCDLDMWFDNTVWNSTPKVDKIVSHLCLCLLGIAQSDQWLNKIKTASSYHKADLKSDLNASRTVFLSFFFPGLGPPF